MMMPWANRAMLAPRIKNCLSVSLTCAVSGVMHVVSNQPVARIGYTAMKAKSQRLVRQYLCAYVKHFDEYIR